MRGGDLYALRLFVSETQTRDGNDSCIPHPRLGAGRIEPAHTPLLLWYPQRSDFSTSPSAVRGSSPGSSLWHPRHRPCSIRTVTQVASSPHRHHCVLQPGSHISRKKKTTERLSPHTCCPVRRHKSLPFCDTRQCAEQSVNTTGVSDPRDGDNN